MIGNSLIIHSIQTFHLISLCCLIFIMRVMCTFKREEDGSRRKLHNDELRSLYSSPNIVRVIKSRGMRWAGHMARKEGGDRCLQGFGWEARREETTGKT
jgi:hypothetical protein